MAPAATNVQETIDECVRELKYNLARAYRDGNRYGEAAALAQELWTRWPREHRFGILLLDCLGLLRQFERRREIIEELGRRIEGYQREAKAELARREDADKKEDKRPRDQFELRQLRELAHGRPLLVEWFRVTQALLEQRPADAQSLLQPIIESDGAIDALNQRLAAAVAELGDLETAHSLLEAALEQDPENALVHAQLARVHFKAGRWEDTITAATESLSLLYFQPPIHGLLGQALMEMKRFAEAEQELRVAVSQNPRNLAAHELLARLYRQYLNKPGEAFAHEGRALSLRNELAGVGQAIAPLCNPVEDTTADQGRSSEFKVQSLPGDELPAPFPVEISRSNLITVVSGLPRSGTSMMMQVLVASGREALVDNKRLADEDNQLGYFEFEKAQDLAKDVSWIPLARGKAVKIVAQLLPFLPRDEHYNVILMERDLGEVVASQKAMLARKGRRGADLKDQQLQEMYELQLQRIRAQLARRVEIRSMSLDYGDLVSDPGSAIGRLAGFLGQPFDREAALGAVRPDLHRQRRERS